MTRHEYHGITYTTTLIDHTPVRAMIDTVIRIDPAWGPKVDICRAAPVLMSAPRPNSRSGIKTPTVEAAEKILRERCASLEWALELMGSCLIEEDRLEAERLAADPRAEKVRVYITAAWLYGAEPMTLAGALRRYAALSQRGQRQGIWIAQGRRVWEEDDESPNGGSVVTANDVRVGLLPYARQALR